MGHMASLGIKWKTVLAPGLVYNAHHFSGVIFQVVANMQRKNKTVMEVLAAGGRYDHLVRTAVIFLVFVTYVYHILSKHYYFSKFSSLLPFDQIIQVRQNSTAYLL